MPPVRRLVRAGRLQTGCRSRCAGKKPEGHRRAHGQDGQAGAQDKSGVHLKSVEIDQSPFRKVFDPGHRFADADGYVKYPNVDLAIEQVNMIDASRNTG